MLRLKYILFVFIFSLAYAQAEQNIDLAELENLSTFGFEENKGQLLDVNGKATPDILFRYQNDIDIYISNKGLSYVFIDANEERIEWHRIDMLLQGVDLSQKKIRKEKPSEQGYINYYLPHCPEGITGVNSYRKIIVENVYDKIDWVIYAFEKQVKYDFLVHPGGDPSQIQFHYEGVENIINNGNNLSLETPLGKITEGDLFCYQTINDNRYTINASYQSTPKFFEYQISNIDQGFALIIDPPLQWGTLYCDRSSPDILRAENFLDMCIDATGNIYITGMIASYTFPVFSSGGGAFMQNSPGFPNPKNAYNACILKFDNNGVRLWATYYGGSTYEEGRGIALDNANNIVVTGFTQSSDFPTFSGGGGNYYQNSLQGLQDAFILKFNNTGVRTWGSYLGGSKNDWGTAVETDNGGNIYVTGYTDSSDFPTQNPGGVFYQGALAGGQDLFLTQFSPGNQMIWSTFIGGDGIDQAYAIDVSNSNEIIITGKSSSSNYPTQNLPGAYNQAIGSGSMDIILTCFNAAHGMKWSTYYGGSSIDEGHAIHFDKNDQVYVTGSTRSTDFPLQNSGGFMQNTFGGFYDWFILKFDANFNNVWSTYYGGDKADVGYGITTDPLGNMFATGYMMSTNTSTMNPGSGAFFQGNNNGFKELFIGKFDASDNMVWATYYGGDGNEEGNEIVTDLFGCPFIVGYTNASVSTTLPTKNPGAGAYYQAHDKLNGNYDGLILKFCPDVVPLVAAIEGEDVACYGDSTGSATVTPLGGAPGYTYAWSPYGGTGATANNLVAGTYTVTIKDTDDSTITKTITINEPTAITISTSAPYNICGGDNITLDVLVSGGTPNYSYNWDNGASTDSSYQVAPTDTSSYKLVVTDSAGCKDSLDLTVNVVPEIIAMVSPDIILCEGMSDTLFASGGSTYSLMLPAGLDDPTSSSPIASPTVTTTYSVIVKSGSCEEDTAVVTVNVVAQVVANAGADKTICEGNEATLSASGGVNYTWSTGDTTENITVQPSVDTDYFVIVDGGICGSDTDSVSVSVNPLPIANAGIDSTIQLGYSIDLNGTGGGTYAWSPASGLSCTNCQDPTASPLITTQYILTVTENGCSSSDTILITVDDFCDDVFIPNAFSPNGDGINDIFYVRGNCIKDMNLVIFDRWGEKVFESNDISKGWDGVFKANYLNSAVFSYYLDATLITGEQIRLEGNISLIR